MNLEPAPYNKPTASSVLAALRRGAALQLCFHKGKPQWTLSNGTQVPDGVAKAVVAHPGVVGDDAGLFANAPPQTYRQRPTS